MDREVDNRPIGVFDSGVGGLTAIKELRKILPNENIVYLGDTGRVPYGSKSRETIMGYAKQDIEFLMSKNVKMIIAACGTVSSILDREYIESIGVPYTGVVAPSAKRACEITRNNKIGIIGTTTTITSEAYGNEIHKIDAGKKVVGKACPLLVNLVENGLVNKDNQITQMVVDMYLKSIKEEKVDTLILGCTHFPIIYDIIAEQMGSEVELVDSGVEVARYVFSLFGEKGFSADQGIGKITYFVTDKIHQFEEVAHIFLGDVLGGEIYQVDVSQL